MSSGATPAAVKIGIIGGTGLDDPEILEGRTEKYVDTPFGKVSIYGDILAFFFFRASLIFLSCKKEKFNCFCLGSTGLPAPGTEGPGVLPTETVSLRMPCT